MSSEISPENLAKLMETPVVKNKIEKIVIERLASILNSQEGWKALVDKIQNAYEIGHLNFPPREE